jgi:uncharacterized membrane protein
VTNARSETLPIPSPTPDGSSPPGLAARATDAVTALIHLYRAEASGMTASRQRLDTTTSWAITSSALVTTFTLGNAQISHAAILFLIFLNFFFLQLEARRFGAYELSRYRVVLLERWFYAEMLGAPIDAPWTHRLVQCLQSRYPKVSFPGALGWRLRRNYLWMYLGVFFVWMSKLSLSGGPMADPGLELARRATVGSVPGALVWAVVAVFYVWLILLAMLAKRLYPLGDEDRPEPAPTVAVPLDAIL